MSTSQHHKADPRSRRSAHTQSSSQSQAHRAEQAMKGFVYESRRTVRERREKYGVGKEWGVMQKILKDLQRLSRMAKAYKMFLKLGIVKALDSFLMDPLPQDILVMCLSIVANLASDSNVCAVMGPSMVQRISDKLIESDSILSRAKGVRALTNMVANPKCAQEIRKCGIGVQLIGWLKACLPPWDLIFASEIGKEEDEEEERASVPGGIVLVGGWMDRWNTETDDAADTKNEEVQEAEETRRGREYIQNKDNRDFLYASLRLLAAVGSIVQVTSASSEAVAVKPQHLVAPVISPLDPHNAQAHAHTRTHMQKSQGLNTSYTTTVVAKTNPLAPVVDVVGCAFVVARYATCFLLVSQALKVLYVYRDHTLSEPDKGTALPSPMSIPPSNAGIGKIDTSNVPRLSGAVAWSERVLDVKRGDGMGLFQSLVHAMVRRAIVGEKGITEEVSTVDEKPSLETPGQEQAYVTADHSSIALTKESVADVYVALQYTLVLLLQWAETAVVIRLRMATQDLIDDLCALVLHTQGKRSVRVLVARLLCVLSEEAVTRGKIKRADGCQGLVQVLLSSPFLNTMLASEERDGRAGLGLEASGDIRRKEGHRVLHAASAHTEEAQQGSETANPRSKQPQTDQQRANVGVDQVTEASGPSSIEVQGSTALHAHNVNDISETEVKGHKEADIKTVTDTTIDNNSPAIDPAIERNPHANLNVVRALLKGLSFYRFDASTLASFFVASAGRHCLRSEDLNNLLHSRDLPIITYTMLLMETATATERSSDAKDVVMDAKLLYTIARLVSESPERSPLRKQGVFIFRHLICAHCLPKLVKFDVLQIIDAMERQQETRSSESSVPPITTNTSLVKDLKRQLATLVADTWGLMMLKSLLEDKRYRTSCALVLGLALPYLPPSSLTYAHAVDIMFNAEVNVTDVLLELISITHLEGERTSTNTAWNGESDGSHTQVEDTETGSSIEKSEIFNEDLMRDYKAREGAGDDGLMAAEVEVAVAKNQNENAREEESVDQPDRGRLRAAQVLADLGHLVRTDREWQHASGWTPNVTKLGRLDAVGYSGNSAGIAAVDPNKETPTATSGRTEPAFEIVPGYSNDTSVNVGSGSTLYATEKSYLEAGTGTRRLEKADVLGSARGSVSMGGGFVLGAKRGQDVLQTDVYLHPHTHPVSVQGASGVGDHTHGTVEGVRSKDGGKLDYQEYNGNTKSSVITFVVNHRAPTAELSGANMGTTFAWDNHGADIPIPVPTSTLDGSVPSSPEAGVGHEGSKIWETHATRIVMPKPHSTVDNPRVSPSHSWDTHTAHVLIPAPHSMTAGSESSPQPDSATSRETTTSEDVPFAQTPTLAPSSTTGKSVSSLLPGAATGHRLSGDGEGNRGVCTRTKRNGDGLDTNSEGRVDPDKETSGTDQKETQPSLFSVDKDNLCAVSTYFRSMLNGRFCEGDQNEVQITSCGARAFQGLLAYLLPRPYGVSQAKSKLGGARPVGKLRKGGELIKKEGAVFSVIGDGEELIDTAGALSESVGEGIKGATSGTDKREPQVKTEVDGPSRRESGEWKIWARLKPRRDASKVPMSEDCAVKNPMEAASSGQLKRKWTDSDGRKTDSDDDVVNVDSDASDLHRGKKAKTEPNPSTGIDPQLHDQQTVEEIRVAQSAFAVDSDHNEDLIEDTRWRDDADTTEVRDQSECGDSSELLDGDVDTDDEYDMEGISRDVVGNYTNAKTTTGGTAPLIRRRNEMDIHNAGWRDVGGSGASNETQSADSSVHVRGPAATASIHTHGGITVRIEKTIGPITNACCEKYFYDNLVPEDALALIPVAQQYMLTELRALCIHKTLENLKQFPEDAYQIGLDTNIEILQFAGIGTVIEMLPQLCEDRRWVPNHRILNGIKSYLADQALHIS